MSADKIDDPLFGPLSWDKSISQWCGFVATPAGAKVQVWIDTGGFEMLPPFDDTAVSRDITAKSRNAFVQLSDLDREGRKALVSEYVPLYEKWNAEPIRPTDFQGRLHLESARIMSDGAVHLFFGDDEMFHGHTLIVYFDAVGSFKYAEMFG